MQREVWSCHPDNRSAKRPRGAGQVLNTCPLLPGPSTTLLFLVGDFTFLIRNLLPKLPLEFCSLALAATPKRRTSPLSLLCSVYCRPNIFFVLENLQTPSSPLFLMPLSSRRVALFPCHIQTNSINPGSSSLIELCLPFGSLLVSHLELGPSQNYLPWFWVLFGLFGFCGGFLLVVIFLMI